MECRSWETSWNLPTQMKLIIFIWKILNSALPTKATLKRRITSMDDICLLCCKDKEDVKHLFFHCECVRAFWFGSHLSLRTDMINLNFVREWIFSLLNKLGKTNECKLEFLVNIICGLWTIWLHRNEVAFSGAIPNPTHNQARF